MRNSNSTQVLQEISTDKRIAELDRFFYDEYFWLETNIVNKNLFIILRPENRLKGLYDIDDAPNINLTDSQHVYPKPIPYIISLFITGVLTIIFAFIIYHAYSRNIFLLDPFIALFGCLASFGLVVTSIVGIIAWGHKK